MTQSDIIETVSKYQDYGIHQDELPDLVGLNSTTVYKNVKRLESWGRIERQKVGKTYALKVVVL